MNLCYEVCYKYIVAIRRKKQKPFQENTIPQDVSNCFNQCDYIKPCLAWFKSRTQPHDFCV